MPLDVVWFCLFGACVRVPVCLYVGMCICMPCTWDRFFFYFSFLNSEKSSVTEEQQKVTFGKQTVWQQRSLLILQLGIFKCNHTKRKWKEREREEEKNKNKGKAKLKLSVCTWVVLNYPILQPGGGFCQLAAYLSLPLHFFSWAFIYSISGSGLAMTAQ